MKTLSGTQTSISKGWFALTRIRLQASVQLAMSAQVIHILSSLKGVLPSFYIKGMRTKKE